MNICQLMVEVGFLVVSSEVSHPLHCCTVPHLDKQTLRQPLFMDVVPRTRGKVDQTIHSLLTTSAPTFQSVIAGFETLS